MVEYIAKNLAIELMHQSSYLSDGDLLEVNGKLAKARIEAEPAADVVPVVHGHWIRHDDADIVEGYYVPEYECSKCGTWKKDDSDFCPDCGARMDGERKGEHEQT